MRTRAIALVLALAVSACGGDDTAATTTTSSSTATSSSSTTTTGAEPLALKLEEAGRFHQPVDVAFVDGETFVAEKGGRVVSLDGTTLVDLSSEVSTGAEQGLLGLTFAPDGSTMYLYFTDSNGDSALISIPRDGDLGKRSTLLAAAQPYANHNGGSLRFGPDGKLYLGLGDGGAGGDPEDRAQNPDEVLGKILRFTLDPFDFEVFALGLRNPWRFSFDRESGDLWVGDVGQDAWEEIDRIPADAAAGINLGWNLVEGTHTYEGAAPEGALGPVYEYSHSEGRSVVGGYVYRGDAIPALRGTYVFADTYTGVLWSLRPDGDGFTFESLDVEVPGRLVSSFAEDADGELWVASLDGGVYRIVAA